MTQQEIIKKTEQYVKNKLSGDYSGHDWWHTYRVWKMAARIAKKEKADLFVVELASLLHDLYDYKISGVSEKMGQKLLRNWLLKLKIKKSIVETVSEIIKDVSFKGAKVKSAMKTKEGKIVQDADRLDAIGAVGIARVFAYGGHKKREIYNSKIKPQMHKNFKQYKNSKNTSINHFYEKLLLLKKLMNTKTAKKIAKERHAFMEKFLKEFFKETKV
jgi:uncharacterized protein